MGKYANVGESVLRDPHGDVLARPGESFETDFTAVQEQSLVAAGAIRIVEASVPAVEPPVPEPPPAPPPPGPGDSVGPAPDPDLVMIAWPPAGPGDAPRGPSPGLVRRVQRSIDGPKVVATGTGPDAPTGD